MLTHLYRLAVLPNPGGNNVKVVHVDKSKSKRVLAEVTIHASVKEVCPAFSYTWHQITPQGTATLVCSTQSWSVIAGNVLQQHGL